MTKSLKPWLDEEVSPELRRLLVAARTQEPSADGVQRVLSGLALADALGSNHPSFAEISAGSATGSVVVGAQWTLWGASLLGMVAVGVAVVGGTRFLAASAPVPSVSAAVTQCRAAAMPSAPKDVAFDGSTAGAAISMLPNAPLQRRETRRNATATSNSMAPANRSPMAGRARELDPEPQPMQATAPNASAVGGQSAFIDRARDALHRGNPGEALRILDQYDRAFARRNFAPEALQLRMRANLRLGNAAAASAAAKTLTDRHGVTPEGLEAAQGSIE